MNLASHQLQLFDACTCHGVSVWITTACFHLLTLPLVHKLQRHLAAQRQLKHPPLLLISLTLSCSVPNGAIHSVYCRSSGLPLVRSQILHTHETPLCKPSASVVSLALLSSLTALVYSACCRCGASRNFVRNDQVSWAVGLLGCSIKFASKRRSNFTKSVDSSLLFPLCYLIVGIIMKNPLYHGGHPSKNLSDTNMTMTNGETSAA